VEFLFFYFILAILVGVFASSKKRSGVGWFFLSLIISPLIGFLIVLIAGPASGSVKKCPKCAEEVKAEAQVCRFCKYEFPQDPVKSDAPEPIHIGEKITQKTVDELWEQRERVLRKKWG